MIPLIYEVAEIVKFIETESRMVVSRVWGEGEKRALLFSGYRVSDLRDEKVLEICFTM